MESKIYCSLEGYDSIFNSNRPNGSSRSWYLEELKEVIAKRRSLVDQLLGVQPTASSESSPSNIVKQEAPVKITKLKLYEND